MTLKYAAWICATVALLLGPAQAADQEEKSGHIMRCETIEELAKVAKAYNQTSDITVSIALVNLEKNEYVCINNLHATYYVREKVGSVEVKGVNHLIMSIDVTFEHIGPNGIAYDPPKRRFIAVPE